MSIQELIIQLTRVQAELGNIEVAVRNQLPIDSCATEEYTQIASSISCELYHEKSNKIVVVIL